MTNLTLTMRQEDDLWIGECKELDLVSSHPERWRSWIDLLHICRVDIQVAVERNLTHKLSFSAKETQ